MEFARKFLPVWMLWWYLDQVHLTPSQISKGALPFRSVAATLSLEGNGKSKKTGIHTEKPSIIGGENATLGEWPWMVTLMTKSPGDPNSEFDCGGSLITSQWVITAAHCFLWADETNRYVRLGDLNLNDEVEDGAKPIDVLIDRVVKHPEFTYPPLFKDIALIRLKEPVSFTDNIRPIRLLSGPKYKTDQYYEGKKAIVIGWGVTENGDPSDILLKASVRVVSKKKCAKHYADNISFTIDENVICAGDKGKDTCSGDSGGPLMFVNTTEGSYYLGGITSGGAGCAEKNHPGIYTKVAQFIDFINEVTGENF